MTQTSRHERVVQAVLFDFDDTLATLAQPQADLAVQGVAATAATLRAAWVLDLPDDFELQWLKALEFAASKSVQEQDEHTADQHPGLPRPILTATCRSNANLCARLWTPISRRLSKPASRCRAEALVALHAAGYHLGYRRQRDM